MTSQPRPSSPPVPVDETIPVPARFLADVAPQISAIEELQVCLAFFRRAAGTGGLGAAVSRQSIVRDRALRKALRLEGSPSEPDNRIAKGLDLAVGRGTLLTFDTGEGDAGERWYLFNTPEHHALVLSLQRGGTALPPGVEVGDDAPVVRVERPNAFRLYEQNIGALTPLIAERILDAVERYPAEWIEEAIGEAVAYNKRNWRYVSRILEIWATEGRGAAPGDTRGHETHRRRDANVLDPDQYRGGRHLDRPGRP